MDYMPLRRRANGTLNIRPFFQHSVALAIVLCPSSTGGVGPSTAVAVAHDGSMLAAALGKPESYCHGHQAACPAEHPLKLTFPEHNQLYAWMFSANGDPRGPIVSPSIEVELMPPLGEPSLTLWQ